MENNNIALSDVERNKELFEYEMTEVILQLKGEFAKVSGKDLHLDDAQFATKKLNIQTGIPEIAVTPIEIETAQATNHISEDTFALPEIQIVHSEIDCPTVPVPASVVLDSVLVEELKLDCPAVKPVNEIIIGEIKLVMPTVPERVQKIAQIDLPNASVSPVSVNQVGTKIKIPENLQKIQLDSEKIEVPNTAVNLPKTETVQTEHFIFTPPTADKISIPIAYDTFSVSVGRIDVPDTVVSVSEPEDISIKPIVLDVPETKTMKYKPVESEILPISDIQIPESINLQFNASISTNTCLNPIEDVSVPKISEYSPIVLQNTSEDNSGLTKVPDIVPIQEIIMTTVDLDERQSITSEVHIPVIPKETIGAIKIDVNQPGINFEYPTVDAVTIPHVKVQKTEGVIVPEKVDFSSDIQAILESAV